jgi:aryl-alcohol dehydrogenase-like predicted oxidoreductase
LRTRYFRKEDFDVLERTRDVAKENDATIAQVALAWLLHKGVTSPIVGATTVKQLEELVESTTLSLAPDQVKRLEEPYLRRATEGHS